MKSALIAAALELLAALVRRGAPDTEVRAELDALVAGWPAPIAAADVDAAVAAGLDRTRGGR